MVPVGAVQDRPTSRDMDTVITTLLEYFFQDEPGVGTIFSEAFWSRPEPG